MTRGQAPIGLLVVLSAALGLAGCAPSPIASPSGTPGSSAVASLVPALEGTPGPSDAASGLPATPVPSLASPVHGVVLHVDSASLGKVKDFTLLTDDNRQVTFTVGVLENGAEFPAAHLSEHVASSEPVLVYFRVQGQDLVVYRLEDPASASPTASPAAS